MIAVVGRVGVRNVHKVSLEVAQVRLNESNAQGEDEAGIRALDRGPADGKGAPDLVGDMSGGDVRRGDGSEREGDEAREQQPRVWKTGEELNEDRACMVREL